jgi:hypothetical protein
MGILRTSSDGQSEAQDTDECCHSSDTFKTPQVRFEAIEEPKVSKRASSRMLAEDRKDRGHKSGSDTSYDDKPWAYCTVLSLGQ